MCASEGIYGDLFALVFNSNLYSSSWVSSPLGDGYYLARMAEGLCLYYFTLLSRATVSDHLGPSSGYNYNHIDIKQCTEVIQHLAVVRNHIFYSSLYFGAINYWLLSRLRSTAPPLILQRFLFMFSTPAATRKYKQANLVVVIFFLHPTK